MKNYKIVLSLVIILVLGLVFGAGLQKIFAQEKEVTFNSVVVFSTAGGYVGFFDRSKGMLYFYDDQLQRCLSKYQLQALGEPGRTLEVERESLYK